MYFLILKGLLSSSQERMFPLEEISTKQAQYTKQIDSMLDIPNPIVLKHLNH